MIIESHTGVCQMKNSMVRAAGLRVRNSRIRDALLNGIPASGPPSLRSKWARVRYASPEGLDEAFKAALPVIEKESNRHQQAAQQIKQQLSSASDADKPELRRQLDHHQVKAQFYNPEVRYNQLVQDVDLSLPVYRHLARSEWAAKEMLILMQRIEQHHMIPDTLPTLEPRAAVRLQFVTPSAHNIEPGVVVPTDVSERLPRLEVQEFEAIPDNSLYSVVIVNPDVPDLENDSFKTGLHYAAVNVPLSNNQPVLDFSKGTELASYLPPHPEKNAGNQRFCVWVFRQPAVIDSAELARDRFDIRSFAAANQLDPVGAHLWRSHWDLATDAIREKYGLGAGNVYYRARTARPDQALLHIRERKKWAPLVGDQ